MSAWKRRAVDVLDSAVVVYACLTHCLVIFLLTLLDSLFV